MKIAITKIGANITFSSQNGSAANADIIYALRTMKGYNHEFTVVTQKTRNTQLPKAINIKEVQNTKDFNAFDMVLVFNGSINFFGGQPDEGLFALYRALAKTNKPIVYVQTDGALYLQKLWPIVKEREWAKNLKESEFEINPNNVYYLTQGRIIQKVCNRLEASKNAILPKEVFHFPWEQCILTEYDRYLPKDPSKYEMRPYDLGFGGYIRNSYKQRRIEKYYDEPDLDTLLFGNLRGIRLRNTKVQPKISYQQMIPTMAQCKATVIVGDEYYNNHFHTLRMYESLLAGNLILIDRILDDRATFYTGVPNSDWYLVDSTEDVRQKLWTATPELVKKTRDRLIEDRLQIGLNHILNVQMEKILCAHQ